jgi:hypothetical protein
MCDNCVNQLLALCVQVQMLNSLLRNGRDVITRLRNEGHFHLTTYGAYSVDGFQGQEADVIIMTTASVSPCTEQWQFPITTPYAKMIY